MNSHSFSDKDAETRILYQLIMRAVGADSFPSYRIAIVKLCERNGYDSKTIQNAFAVLHDLQVIDSDLQGFDVVIHLTDDGLALFEGSV